MFHSISQCFTVFHNLLTRISWLPWWGIRLCQWGWVLFRRILICRRLGLGVGARTCLGIFDSQQPGSSTTGGQLAPAPGARQAAGAGAVRAAKPSLIIIYPGPCPLRLWSPCAYQKIAVFPSSTPGPRQPRRTPTSTSSRARAGPGLRAFPQRTGQWIVVVHLYQFLSNYWC